MKKLLFIISLIFCFAGFGQIPTNNADFVWSSGYTENAGKYYFNNDLGGYYTEIEIINASSVALNNINNGYVECRDSIKLIMYGVDTVEPTKLWWNIEDADTFYCEHLDRTYNSDGTELLPFRLNSMVHCTTATDLRSYFSGVEITETMIIVPDDYSTIFAAITAATTGDTIAIRGGNYDTYNYTDKELTYLGIGDVDCEYAGAVFYTYGAVPIHIHNISMKGSSTYGAIRIANTVNTANNTINNCVIDGNTHTIHETTDIGNTSTFSNNIIKGEGYAQIRNNYVSNGNFYKSEGDYSFRCYSTILSSYDVITSPAIKLILSASEPDSMVFKDCDINGSFAQQQDLISDLYLKFANCNITGSQSSGFFYNTVAGSNLDIVFDSCTFNRDITSAANIYQRTGAGKLILSNSEAYNFPGAFFNSAGTGTDTAIITNNTFVNGSDTIASINLTDYITLFEDNTLTNMGFQNINTGTALYHLVDSNKVHMLDSVAFRCRGLVTFSNNEYTQDTGGFFEIVCDTAYVNNNIFRFKPDNVQGNYLNLTPNETDGYIKLHGNDIYLPGYFGKTNADGHIFNTSNTTVFEFNRVYNAIIGVVSKNLNSDPSHEFIVNNNIFVDCRNPIYLRAMPYAKIYNNTIVDISGKLEEGVWIDDNDGIGASVSIQIKNNIIRSSTGDYLHFNTSDLSDTVGLVCEKNIISEINSVRLPSGNITINEWKTIGYDTNSSTENPKLNALYQPSSESFANGSGAYLGEEFAYRWNPVTKELERKPNVIGANTCFNQSTQYYFPIDASLTQHLFYKKSNNQYYFAVKLKN